MTTGERLVQISTLSTGTAQDHLLNVDFGGTGEILYVDRRIIGIVCCHNLQGIIKKAR